MWPYVYPAACLSKIVLSFHSLGQTELTNEKFSIEDRSFNGRTWYLSFWCVMFCTFPYWNSKEYFKEGYFSNKGSRYEYRSLKWALVAVPVGETSVCPSVYLPVCLSVCQSVGLSVSQPVCLSACPSVSRSVSLDQGLTQSVSSGCLIHSCDIDLVFGFFPFRGA